MEVLMKLSMGIILSTPNFIVIYTVARLAKVILLTVLFLYTCV